MNEGHEIRKVSLVGVAKNIMENKMKGSFFSTSSRDRTIFRDRSS